uniref:BZIP domain-containing protein n=1 Tax=Daucus carota subsp. sativus TaxID=79200 RepID=A0A165ZT86_DAUCS
MMMQTEGDPSLKLRSSFSLNLELEVAEALTDLAKPLEINIPEQPEAFSPSIDESLEPTSPLHLALWTDNQDHADHAVVVQQYGERESSVTVKKSTQTGKDTEFLPDSSGSETRVKTIQDLNVVPEDHADHAVVVQQYGERESSVTVKKSTQTGKDTEFLPDSSGSETRVKTIQDLNVVPEDCVFEGQQDSEKETHKTVKEPIHTEENAEIQQNPNDGKSSAPPVSCKSRREMNRLTEDQKEARKLRRMLANRLSARQTILKRQARCDELAKKAAELQCENDNLKKCSKTLTLIIIICEKEKEVALRKYNSLKSTNERLKAQLKTGVTEKVEVEEVDETREGSKCNNGHPPTQTSLSTQQYYIFNQPSGVPCVFPYITPGSNIVQSAPQDVNFVASQAPVLANGINCSLLEHDNPLRMSIPVNASYALPYHWFIPPMHHADRVPPQSMDLADKPNVTNQYRRSVADTKKDQRLRHKKIRGEASTSREAIKPSVQGDHEKASGKKPAHKPKVATEAVTNSSSEGNEETVVGMSCASKRRNGARNRRNEAVTCAAATSSSSEEIPQPPLDRLLRRRMDAYSTAAARKRRKEVIKMKNFQYSRQSRVRISSN